MHPTKNDLPPAARQKVAGILSQMLADASDLKSQCKQAHWNVRGATFIALHELFDRVAAEVETATDTIAERMLQLGFPAEGTVRAAAKRSRLKEYPFTTAGGEEHAQALSSALAGFNTYCRSAIDETAAAGDAVTADILTEINGGLDKQLWFVEAHLDGASAEGRQPLKSVK